MLNKSIIIIIFFGIVHSISFISSVISITVSNAITDPVLIGLVLSTKRLSRLFFDIPIGLNFFWPDL